MKGSFTTVPFNSFLLYGMGTSCLLTSRWFKVHSNTPSYNLVKMYNVSVKVYSSYCFSKETFVNILETT